MSLTKAQRSTLCDLIATSVIHRSGHWITRTGTDTTTARDAYQLLGPETLTDDDQLAPHCGHPRCWRPDHQTVLTPTPQTTARKPRKSATKTAGKQQ